jgi:hypothetical protein
VKVKSIAWKNVGLVPVHLRRVLVEERDGGEWYRLQVHECRHEIEPSQAIWEERMTRCAQKGTYGFQLTSRFLLRILARAIALLLSLGPVTHCTDILRKI